MVPEYTSVILIKDRPETGLRAGDIGVVVHNHSEGNFAEVEFMAVSGDTLAVLTLPETAFRTARPNEIPHVRTAPEAAE